MNREIQARADVFLGAQVTSGRHTGKDIPMGTQRLETLPPHIIQLDTHGQGALVSCLTNKGKEYVVIQNTSVASSLQTAVKTDGQLALVLPDGTRQPAALYGPLIILTLANLLILDTET